MLARSVVPPDSVCVLLVLKLAGMLNVYWYHAFAGSAFGRLKNLLRATPPIRTAPVADAVVFTKIVILSPAVLLFSR